MRWDHVFHYGDGVLTWKVTHRAGFKAGVKMKQNGYIKIVFMGERYRAHRIVWEMHNGEIPDGMQIDHINNVRDDNRIENLRVVSNKDNSKNRSINSNNKSGVMGVSWDSSRGKWSAEIKPDGQKVFLGRFNSIEEASKVRKIAENEFNFHENHGV